MTAKSFIIISLALAMVLGVFLTAGTAAADDGHISMVTVPTLNNTLEVIGTDVFYVTSGGVPRHVFIADKCRAHTQKQPVAVYLNYSEVLKGFRDGHSLK